MFNKLVSRLIETCFESHFAEKKIHINDIYQIKFL